MKIIPCGSVATVHAPESYFTGKVLQTPIIEAEAPARLRALMVAFEPGARTAWHTHPLGQTLHIVSGAGRVQVWGEPIREIRAGDTVFFAPGEKHWHGAGPTTAMTHIAMQEALDGKTVDWLGRCRTSSTGRKDGRADRPAGKRHRHEGKLLSNQPAASLSAINAAKSADSSVTARIVPDLRLVPKSRPAKNRPGTTPTPPAWIGWPCRSSAPATPT
jgi:quercetin dioxygenase-like cupin family protein